MLTDVWLLVSIVLTGLAAVLLGFAILPAQAAALWSQDPADDGRLGMVSGVFNLLWATVVVLMIVRPGSTTGT